jgi:hypothetical protein
MYNSPKLERFGSMRDLTMLGISADCDGGIHGIGDGDWLMCNNNGGGKNDRS